VCLPLPDVIVHEFDQFRWLFAQEIAATNAVKVPSESARPLRCSEGAVEGSGCDISPRLQRVRATCRDDSLRLAPLVAASPRQWICSCWDCKGGS
jgi:hypothetical protein